MAALPVEVLLGIYLGILTGIIPALVAWTLGFVFKYFTGVTVPGFGVVVLGVAIAGVNGGLLALNDPTIKDAPNSITLTTALVVVLMLTLYAHAKGDAMGASFPKRLSLRKLGQRTLSTDVVELIGGRGQVRITVAGTVGDLEGYAPLPADMRTDIATEEWSFPADLPIAELETRLADTLRTKYDLAEVSVTIDEQGTASIDAAPPTGGVSKRVPPGKRAVSIGVLVPTGLARDDEVTLFLDEETVRGTVVSAQSSVSDPTPAVETDGGQSDPTTPPLPSRAPTTDGGEGRVTVAVSRDDASRVLAAERAHLVVRSRGTRREFELLSVLRRAGKRFRQLTLGSNSSLVGVTIGDARLREEHGVVVLAHRRSGTWTIAPRGATELDAGDDLIVVGARENLDRFTEVTA